MSTKGKTKRCEVCNAFAKNVNFGGLSCESCKIFFRRTVFKSKKYNCKYNDNCSIIPTNRKCIACRLNRCYQAGMRKEFIYLKFPKQISNKKDIELEKRLTLKMSTLCNTNSSTSEPVIYSNESIEKKSHQLSNYEKELLTHLSMASKAFPDERKAMAIGNVVRINDAVKVTNYATLYIVHIIRYANSFEQFRSLDIYNQTQLTKPFFDYFFTIWFSFFFNENFTELILLGDDNGENAVLIKWEEMIQPINNQYPKVVAKFKSMVKKIHEILENDSIIRDSMIAILLFQPNNQLTCSEFVQYYSTFYSTILKRYLNFKYQNIDMACKQYQRLISIVDLCKEIRSMSDLFFSFMDINKLNHLVRELYELH